MIKELIKSIKNDTLRKQVEKELQKIDIQNVFHDKNSIKEEFQEIVEGVYSGIDISLYARKEFDLIQKKFIRFCLEENIEYKKYIQFITNNSFTIKSINDLINLITKYKNINIFDLLPLHLDITQKEMEKIIQCYTLIPDYFLNTENIKNMKTNWSEVYKIIQNSIENITDLTLFFDKKDERYIKQIYNGYVCRFFSTIILSKMKNRLKLMYKRKNLSSKYFRTFRKLIIFAKKTKDEKIYQQLIKSYNNVFLHLPSYRILLPELNIDLHIDDIIKFARNQNRFVDILDKLVVLYNFSISDEINKEIYYMIQDFCFSLFINKVDINKYNNFINFNAKRIEEILGIEIFQKKLPYQLSLASLPEPIKKFNLKLIKHEAFIYPHSLFYKLEEENKLDNVLKILDLLITDNQKLNKLRFKDSRLYSTDFIKLISERKNDDLENLSKYFDVGFLILNLENVSKKNGYYRMQYIRLDDLYLFESFLRQEYKQLYENNIITKEQFLFVEKLYNICTTNIAFSKNIHLVCLKTVTSFIRHGKINLTDEFLSSVFGVSLRNMFVNDYKLMFSL
ncbi:MAG: hypothetical protein N2505_00135 [Endomicrobia bacterium]|nr:hypothetical protein [Endomicrobiia bacterium]